jgi:hypothetical protein
MRFSELSTLSVPKNVPVLARVNVALGSILPPLAKSAWKTGLTAGKLSLYAIGDLPFIQLGFQ